MKIMKRRTINAILLVIITVTTILLGVCIYGLRRPIKMETKYSQDNYYTAEGKVTLIFHMDGTFEEEIVIYREKSSYHSRGYGIYYCHNDKVELFFIESSRPLDSFSMNIRDGGKHLGSSYSDSLSAGFNFMGLYAVLTLIVEGMLITSMIVINKKRKQKSETNIVDDE